MTTLYLIRHGLAAAAGPGMRDSERPLRSEGVSQTQLVARTMARMGMRPARFFSSPRLRARQTAEIFQQELGLEHSIESLEDLGGGGRVGDVIAAIRSRCDDQDVAAVGHMPDMADYVSQLCGAGQSLLLEFRPATIAVIDFGGPPRPGAGILKAILPPSSMSQVAEAVD